jgi:hypothetical protein
MGIFMRAQIRYFSHLHISPAAIIVETKKKGLFTLVFDNVKTL